MIIYQITLVFTILVILPFLLTIFIAIIIFIHRVFKKVDSPFSKLFIKTRISGRFFVVAGNIVQQGVREKFNKAGL